MGHNEVAEVLVTCNQDPVVLPCQSENVGVVATGSNFRYVQDFVSKAFERP